MSSHSEAEKAQWLQRMCLQACCESISAVWCHSIWCSTDMMLERCAYLWDAKACCQVLIVMLSMFDNPDMPFSSGPVVYTAGRNCFLPGGLHPLGGCGRAAGIGVCHTKQDQDEQCGIYDGWPRRCCGRCLFGCQELPQASGGEVSPARAEVLASVWTFASSCTTACHWRAGVWGMPLCKPSLGVLPWLVSHAALLHHALMA